MTTDQQIKVDAYKFGGGELTARLLKCDDKFAKIKDLVQHIAENYDIFVSDVDNGDFTIVPYIIAFDNAVDRSNLTERQRTFVELMKEYGEASKVAKIIGDDDRNFTRDFDVIVKKIAIEFAKGDSEAWK